MRLHNRQIKASFWTDTDLIRELPLAGRLFYLGLIQIADDSGCLDDDAMAFKILLFPGDQDLTEDVIRSFRDKLVAMKKLIPYEVEGKKCLYLKNFHKHQTIKNPASPVVPLPPWVLWQPYDTNPRKGKYFIEAPSELGVSKSSEECKKRVSKSCLMDYLRNSPNQEPITKNHEPRTNNQEPADAETDGSFFQKWDETFGTVLTSVKVAEIDGLTANMDKELVLKAIDITKEQVDAKAVKGRAYNYFTGILGNWLEKGIRTLDDLEVYETECNRPRGDPDDDEYIPPLNFYTPDTGG